VLLYEESEQKGCALVRKKFPYDVLLRYLLHFVSEVEERYAVPWRGSLACSSETHAWTHFLQDPLYSSLVLLVYQSSPVQNVGEYLRIPLSRYTRGWFAKIVTSFLIILSYWR